MDIDKTLTRATLGVAILGLFIVVYTLATDSIPATSKGYSELYFENPDEVPDVVEVGKKYAIPFVVSSNEKKAISYNYTVTFDGAEIIRDKFTLTPEEKKTLTVELIPDASDVSSWKLSSNGRQRLVDHFTIDAAFIKEDKNGSVAVYPVKFNQDMLSAKGLLLLPLNRRGLYSTESDYVIHGSEVWIRSTMSIGTNEIYIEHLSEAEDYNFSWSNSVRLPDSYYSYHPAIVWLGMPKISYPESKLQSGSIAYKNNSIEFNKGLIGDIYISPIIGVAVEYIISYSSTKSTPHTVDYVEKNVTVTVGVDVEGHLGENAISIENIIKEETYALEKVKLSILLNSDAGKSYEINFWSYIVD